MLAFWILVCRFVAVVVKPLVQAPTSELGCYASAANLPGPLFLYPNFNICSSLTPLFLGLRIEITITVGQCYHPMLVILNMGVVI